MSKNIRPLKIKGFTLVELLVVIAIIALLVAIVFPAISTALQRGRVTATAVNGRNIHQAVVGAATADIYVSASSPWPNRTRNQGRDASSTTYFTYLVTNRILNVAWSFFAPPGVPAAQEMSQFAAANNGWCVVDNSENMLETAPFLFTRNLTITTLVTPTLETQLDENEVPFGNSGLAFVTRGGGALSLVGDDIRTQERFDGLFITRGVDGADLGNNILRPAGSN